MLAYNKFAFKKTKNDCKVEYWFQKNDKFSPYMLKIVNKIPHIHVCPQGRAREALAPLGWPK